MAAAWRTAGSREPSRARLVALLVGALLALTLIGLLAAAKWLGSARNTSVHGGSDANVAGVELELVAARDGAAGGRQIARQPDASEGRAPIAETSADNQTGVIKGWVHVTEPDLDADDLARVVTTTTYDDLSRLLAAHNKRARGGVAIDLEGSGVRRRTVSGDDGWFYFGELPAGEYRISAEVVFDLPRGAASIQGRSEHVLLDPDTLTQWVRLDIHAHPASIEGTVRGLDGHPCIGARVRAFRVPIPGLDDPRDFERYRTEPCATATTDERGRYRLENLEPTPLWRAAYVLLGIMPDGGVERVELRVTPLDADAELPVAATVRLLPETTVTNARALADALLAMPDAIGLPVHAGDPMPSIELPRSLGDRLIDVVLVDSAP